MLSAGAVAAKMGAGEHAPAIDAACAEFGIDTPLEIAHFLAQVAVESDGFNKTIESLNYSIEGLLKTFSRARISAGDCANFGRTAGRAANQEAIANRVYGGDWGLENLGNAHVGDGWKFRGRCIAQITGADNVGRCSQALFKDGRLLIDPTPLSMHADVGARAACWFWNYKRCSEPAAADNVTAVTRRWNGGLNGIDHRIERLAFAKKQLGIA
jgi:putative chitinase